MAATLPGHRRRHLVVVAALAVLASACQIRVGTDVTITSDGSGGLALTVAVDEEIVASLAADEIDLFAGLEALPDDWTVERSDPDGGAAVTITADFDDPAGLRERVGDLRAGLDDEDPMLLDDVEVTVDEDGGATFSGRAGFRPPSSTGIRGVGVQFDGDDLAALLTERGDEVLRVDLRVTMPGPVVDGNADQVDGSVATWRLPVTELAEVRLVSEAGADRRWWVVVAAALVGVVFGLGVVSLLRRR